MGWKYKRKKKKKGEGTGTEDSQDSQEDSGSVNSGSESAAGSLSSSSSTPLPQTPSVAVQQHRGLEPQSNSPIATGVAVNTSAISNIPSNAIIPHGLDSPHQYHSHPTPSNVELQGMPSSVRQ